MNTCVFIPGQLGWPRTCDNMSFLAVPGSMDSDPESPIASNSAPISRVPSYIQFAPKRAMASFENLVALANYEERLRICETRRPVQRTRGGLRTQWGPAANVGECGSEAGIRRRGRRVRQRRIDWGRFRDVKQGRRTRTRYGLLTSTTARLELVSAWMHG